MTGKLNDVTLPVDTATFDLDAWLDDAAPPETVTTVLGRGDLVAEYQRLDAELAEAQRALTEGTGSGRLNSPDGAKARELAERMDAVHAQMVASRLSIRLRAITKDTHDEILTAAKALPEAERESYVEVQYVAASAVSPEMDVEKVKRLRERIGAGQFDALQISAWNITNNRSVEVPFSLRSSAVLATQAT